MASTASPNVDQQASGASQEEEEEYDVERIMDYEIQCRSNEPGETYFNPTLGKVVWIVAYLVKWKEYDESENSWEPKESFNPWVPEYDDMVEAIRIAKGRKPTVQQLEEDVLGRNEAARLERSARKGKGRGKGKKRESSASEAAKKRKVGQLPADPSVSSALSTSFESRRLLALAPPKPPPRQIDVQLPVDAHWRNLKKPSPPPLSQFARESGSSTSKQPTSFKSRKRPRNEAGQFFKHAEDAKQPIPPLLPKATVVDIDLGFADDSDDEDQGVSMPLQQNTALSRPLDPSELNQSEAVGHSPSKATANRGLPTPMHLPTAAGAVMERSTEHLVQGEERKAERVEEDEDAAWDNPFADEDSDQEQQMSAQIQAPPKPLSAPIVTARDMDVEQDELDDATEPMTSATGTHNALTRASRDSVRNQSISSSDQPIERLAPEQPASTVATQKNSRSPPADDQSLSGMTMELDEPTVAISDLITTADPNSITSNTVSSDGRSIGFTTDAEISRKSPTIQSSRSSSAEVEALLSTQSPVMRNSSNEMREREAIATNEPEQAVNSKRKGTTVAESSSRDQDSTASRDAEHADATVQQVKKLTLLKKKRKVATSAHSDQDEDTSLQAQTKKLKSMGRIKKLSKSTVPVTRDATPVGAEPSPVASCSAPLPPTADPRSFHPRSRRSDSPPPMTPAPIKKSDTPFESPLYTNGLASREAISSENGASVSRHGLDSRTTSVGRQALTESSEGISGGVTDQNTPAVMDGPHDAPESPPPPPVYDPFNRGFVRSSGSDGYFDLKTETLEAQLRATQFFGGAPAPRDVSTHERVRRVFGIGNRQENYASFDDVMLSGPDGRPRECWIYAPERKKKGISKSGRIANEDCTALELVLSTIPGIKLAENLQETVTAVFIHVSEATNIGKERSGPLAQLDHFRKRPDGHTEFILFGREIDWKLRSRRWFRRFWRSTASITFTPNAFLEEPIKMTTLLMKWMSYNSPWNHFEPQNVNVWVPCTYVFPRGPFAFDNSSPWADSIKHMEGLCLFHNLARERAVQLMQVFREAKPGVLWTMHFPYAGNVVGYQTDILKRWSQGYSNQLPVAMPAYLRGLSYEYILSLNFRQWIVIRAANEKVPEHCAPVDVLTMAEAEKRLHR
ncbi:hypothetical protein OIO90_002253 [Microbotryomycetes sp. JL221]|nr:hypothetical protein OIO90_002253 [Microbotryomycetes sp. JL221]